MHATELLETIRAEINRADESRVYILRDVFSRMLQRLPSTHRHLTARERTFYGVKVAKPKRYRRPFVECTHTDATARQEWTFDVVDPDGPCDWKILAWINGIGIVSYQILSCRAHGASPTAWEEADALDEPADRVLNLIKREANTRRYADKRSA
jgi:hypothetical protein